MKIEKRDGAVVLGTPLYAGQGAAKYGTPSFSKGMIIFAELLTQRAVHRKIHH